MSKAKPRIVDAKILAKDYYNNSVVPSLNVKQKWDDLDIMTQHILEAMFACGSHYICNQEGLDFKTQIRKEK